MMIRFMIIAPLITILRVAEKRKNPIESYHRFYFIRNGGGGGGGRVKKERMKEKKNKIK